jgi:predicted permease
VQDIRSAFRAIAAHRWFSAAIVATLALGIGINATVFALSDAVLFKPLPFPHGDRIVVVVSTQLSNGATRMNMSYPDFVDLRARASSFARLEARLGYDSVISEATVPPESVPVGRVTAGLFALTSVSPVLGRALSADDERADAPAVMVIGYGLWRARYNQARDVVGRVVRVNDLPVTIVGVMPDGYAFPNNEQAWMPLRPVDHERDARDNRSLIVMGLLKPGVSIASAGREVDAIAAQLAASWPATNRGIGANALTFNQRFNNGPVRTVFQLILAAVGLVLLVACANVANMMLSAALKRHRDIAIRTALGASRVRVVRQLLVESVMLGLAGGVIGLGLALAGVHLFNVAVTPENTGKPSWIVFAVDYRVLAYLVAISVGSAVVFGLAPALRSARVDVNDVLKEGGRGGSGRSGWLSDALVVAQFTMAVVLLTASGLMLRSLLAGEHINAWMPSDRLLTASVQLPASRYPDADARIRFFEAALPRLAALPGVTQAAVMTMAPGLGAPRDRIEIDGHLVDTPNDRPLVARVAVSDAYFAAIDLPIVRGRAFEAADGRPGHEAAVVSRAFASRYWPNEDPIGRRFRFNNDRTPGPWLTVVGVSGDVVMSVTNASRGEVEPFVITPYRQSADGGVMLALRTAGAPAALTNVLRRTMQAADPELVVSRVDSLDAQLRAELWPYRVFGTLFFVFALAALAMAAVGLYAVMSQQTTRRTREIGIRMALGATPLRVLGTVMRRGIVQIAIGLALGIGAAFAVTRTMRSLLVGVEPTDPATFVTSAIVLVSVGVAACWLPARRASAMPAVRALAEGDGR